jgi:hypothetical protein
MPTEQGVGLDEEPMELCSGDQPAEAGKERSIRGSKSRACHLSSEDGNLVTEHDDLDSQIGVVKPLQANDLHSPEEGEIEEREGHGPFSRSLLFRRKSHIKSPDEVFGTHRVDGVDPHDDMGDPGPGCDPGPPLATGRLRYQPIFFGHTVCAGFCR